MVEMTILIPDKSGPPGPCGANAELHANDWRNRLTELAGVVTEASPDSASAAPASLRTGHRGYRYT